MWHNGGGLVQGWIPPKKTNIVACHRSVHCPGVQPVHGPLAVGGERTAANLTVDEMRCRGGGGGRFGMTPWCDDLACSWRRLLADRHSLPFPWTLSLHRRWCPSASHHPLTFLFLPALTFPLPSPFLSLGLSLRRPQEGGHRGWGVGEDKDPPPPLLQAAAVHQASRWFAPGFGTTRESIQYLSRALRLSYRWTNRSRRRRGGRQTRGCVPLRDALRQGSAGKGPAPCARAPPSRLPRPPQGPTHSRRGRAGGECVGRTPCASARALGRPCRRRRGIGVGMEGGGGGSPALSCGTTNPGNSP